MDKTWLICWDAGLYLHSPFIFSLYSINFDFSCLLSPSFLLPFCFDTLRGYSTVTCLSCVAVDFQFAVLLWIPWRLWESGIGRNWTKETQVLAIVVSKQQSITSLTSEAEAERRLFSAFVNFVSKCFIQQAENLQPVRSFYLFTVLHSTFRCVYSHV